uniref:LAGLIDADG endonuclease n=1 Tax=Metarhizium album TaxID=92629 RepID=A0A891H0J0_9HYPO|nr:LAGLIDADG endonuclease [Metarhizium album]QRK27502.1 LAGLIDADG endonuclease [Metarhizium album]
MWFGKSIHWDKLPNSGKALKLLILNYSRKAISGWSNFSDIVTSQKIYESLIGNRGSKSVICNNIIVKEQRVDGSCIEYFHKKNYSMLRYTLVGFERSYQTKIPSNFINLNRNFCTLESKLNPFYVTGFVDGEGSFILTIIRNNKYKSGWRVACRFIISLHKKDLKLLNNIKEFFGTGNVFLMSKDSAQYRVESLPGLDIIINHFDKYSLITQKQADFKLLKLAHGLIKNKSHLTKDGLLKLVALKAVINNGMNNDLSIAFPDIHTVLRPGVQVPKIMNPNWLSGFVEGEGCFSVVIFKNKTSKLGEAVKLSFIITQSIRDEYLIKSLIEYLGCGNTSLDSRGTIDFKITKFSSLRDIILPFFAKYPLKGNKSLDLSDFSEIIRLMENKSHLTLEGLNKIKQIRNKMNTNRK